ncbi:putative uncharacterized protein DDB_G0289263 isoform X2 [Chironomus tepperi]|uniref:putative uncharacterized protein DDB_G0289263 isoform X2 n=1 Tax=Chironomus tepperi TaxID=113505 RepID=UPI00391F9935
MAVAIIDNGAYQTHLKHVDPSIVLFSSSTDMTRYDIADLKRIKDSKLSQQPPSCFYDPNIMRLNILKYKNRDPVVVDIQMKAFREKLQNLSVTGWDPHIFQLLRNYHNALLNPFYNGYTGNYQNQQQQIFNQHQPPAFNQQPQYQQPPPDQVLLMEKQQAVLDKIPSYDRKMNFFDNITTTANIPPPRTMMNFDHRPSQATFFKRPNNNQNQSNHIRKPNSCASEQHGSSYSSSVGYFSGNESKSSFGEESLLEKPMEKQSCYESNRKNEPRKDEEEKEPEWFSVPATLEDFIDLHGFSDEDVPEQQNENNRKAEPKKGADNQRNNMSNNSFRNEYQPNQNRRYNHNNSYNRYSHNNSGYTSSSHNSSYNNQSFSSHNSSYSQNNNSYYNPRNMNYRNNPVNNNANQRFRNPLHFNKQAKPTTAPQIINPFFDAWKSGKFLHQQNVSFTDMMEQNNYPKVLPSNAMYISDVENHMKQQQNQIPLNQIAPPTAVPQFFQNLANNWGVRVNENPPNAYQYQNNVGPPLSPPQAMHDGYKLPTQEQLHQFTSEIMRNAILRKNQQYHDENNYPK